MFHIFTLTLSILFLRKKGENILFLIFFLKMFFEKSNFCSKVPECTKCTKSVPRLLTAYYTFIINFSLYMLYTLTNHSIKLLLRRWGLSQVQVQVGLGVGGRKGDLIKWVYHRRRPLCQYYNWKNCAKQEKCMFIWMPDNCAHKIKCLAFQIRMVITWTKI